MKKNDMSQFKVGEIVDIKVAVIDKMKKVVPKNFEGDFEIKSFEIIAKYKVHPELNSSYMVIVEPDMVGWTVSSSHMLYYDLDLKFLNLKFYDVNDDFIIVEK